MSDEEAPTLDKSSIIKIGDNPYVEYDGLLDYAHQKGMTSLMTEPVQLPNEGNGYLAVFKGTAVFEEDGKVKTFTKHGSAQPPDPASKRVGNVKGNMVNYLIEMADTRAAARAMRDGCRIGTVVDVEMAGSQISDKQAVSKPANGNGGKINTGSVPCPSCYAPPGKPHTAKCTATAPTTPAQSPPVAKTASAPMPPKPPVENDDDIEAEIAEYQKKISALCKLLGKPNYTKTGGKVPEGWTYSGLWKRFARTPYTAAVTLEEHKVVEKRMSNLYDSITGDAAGYDDADEFVKAANAALGMEGDTLGDWSVEQFDRAVTWLKTGATERKAA